MAPTSPPPILLLPDELLIEIAAAKPQKLLTPEPPSEWVLSHVCSRFRRVVTGACTLWTQVVVDLCSHSSAELLRLYLERSAPCDIEVTLRAMDDDLEAPKGLQYLGPHIARISRLTIVVDSHQALDTILDSFRDIVMPSLDHLEIENTSDYDSDLLDLSPLNLPKISFFKMTRCTPSFPPPPWMVALTHLHLSKNSFGEDTEDIFRFITTRLSSVVHLYLDVGGVIDTFRSGNGIVSQSLTHLEVEFDETLAMTDALAKELASFDTPHLTHLGLHCTHGDQLAFLFNSTMQSRFPALTSLTFNDLGQLSCRCEEGCPDDYKPITNHHRTLFPIMSSLTLIRECFAPRIVSDLLGPGSPPWPLFEALALRPRPSDVEDLYTVLQDVVRWKRSQLESLPRFKLSPDLLSGNFGQRTE
ncbi:hypothetical protein FB45DRAFT_1059108 [Roridomyces roridus]|uniref:F-box domain-containing protein n=1 Tax=Roridomyces roridus TaxID=1738132 RepID=A0AAD7BQW6_9AGAR|nr:hypothetical protein FB45DRAFT_1059108 [Roridomyces roridus]